jgi:hypothetical protein
MAFNPPPELGLGLGLKKTYRMNKPPAVVAPEIRNPIVLAAQELFKNPNLTSFEKTQIFTLMQETDPANLAYLQAQMRATKTRLGLPQGGRRRRTRRNKKSKKSMRRRR